MVGDDIWHEFRKLTLWPPLPQSRIHDCDGEIGSLPHTLLYIRQFGGGIVVEEVGVSVNEEALFIPETPVTRSGQRHSVALLFSI